MNICAVVVEYNPFHFGHEYHLRKAREMTQCDVLVAIMSPHFVQRGEPAIFDKWARTQAALNAGVDCVIELPTPFATQSAQVFSKAAVMIADLAKANHLVFGSETADLALLKEIASMEININHFKEYMANGTGYPKALSMTSIEAKANDILAIGYLKAMANTAIQPHVLLRTNDYHSLDATQTISSATAIRQALKSKLPISHTSAMTESFDHAYMEDYYPYIRYKLINLSLVQLRDYFLMDEGIEGLLKKKAIMYNHYEDFLNACISKRYSRSRIQRICLHLYLNHLREESPSVEEINTFRVLGFNQTGQSYLRHLSQLEVSFSTNFKQLPASYRTIEYQAAQHYALPYGIEREKKLISQEISSLIIV